ncbi:MAG: nitrilase-related carbon-nitrogen hydrolase, partial [Verrucomicrobiota bacterium]|nr:nitrilase-related carbon-nitrogen hydrolase [Verrucomicrobiota bacterium]
DPRRPETDRPALASEQPPHLCLVTAMLPNMRTTHWTRLLEARAIENLAYVVGVNRTGSDPYLSYDGASVIIDPLGKTLCLADHKEQVLQAHVEAHVVDQWRETFPALKDRR